MIYRRTRTALARHYPALSQRERLRLLLGCTAYPMVTDVHLARRIGEIRAATDGTLADALAWAGRVMGDRSTNYRFGEYRETTNQG